MDKVYVLMQDLPYIKAGTEYVSADGFNGVFDKCSYVPNKLGMMHERFAIHIDWIKDNPTWFIEKKEQEWEIQSFINATNDVVLTRFPDGLYRWKQQHSGDTSEALLAMPHMKIYSVKRLSDGQTFSVGDETTYGVIEKFYISWAGMEVHFTNGSGATLASIEKAKQQPPQEEQKDNDVFEIKKPPLGVTPAFIHKEQRLDDIMQAMNRFNDFHNHTKLCPQEWLDEKHELEEWLLKFKASKSTTKEEKIRVMDISGDEKSNMVRVFFNDCVDNIPPEKYQSIKQAIENVLNNYPNPEFGKAAYERLMDQNQQILEENSKMYVDTQKQLREAFEAARHGKTFNAYEQKILSDGCLYKTFEDYLQSLNNK